MGNVGIATTINSLISVTKNEDAREKYLTFEVNGKKYGISVSNVISVDQIQEATTMPGLPYYAKGNINYYGTIVPLIDLSLRLGEVEQEYTSQAGIIVVDIDGVQIGFMVGAIKEIHNINDEQISPPPSLCSEAGGRVMVGVALIEKDIVFLLNSRALACDK